MTTWTSPPDPDLDRDPFDRHLQPIAHPCPRPDRHGPHQWRPATLTGGLRCPGSREWCTPYCDHPCSAACVVRVTADQLDGGYVAERLDVPGAMAQGETADEALTRLAHVVIDIQGQLAGVWAAYRADYKSLSDQIEAVIALADRWAKSPSRYSDVYWEVAQEIYTALGVRDEEPECDCDHCAGPGNCPRYDAQPATDCPTELPGEVGTGAGRGGDPEQTEATLWVNGSTDCPEAPAQAHLPRPCDAILAALAKPAIHDEWCPLVWPQSGASLADCDCTLSTAMYAVTEALQATAGPWAGRGATNGAPDDSRTVRDEEKP